MRSARELDESMDFALEEKIMRAQKKKHEAAVQQIQKIKEKLFPNGELQERVENFIPYYLKYGGAALTKSCR